jgi:predicted ATP-dependent endonuclease of OLD family
MKIKSLKISNILSFKYVADIAMASEISFEDNLNIIIGENGAGKSTALEIINFLFKRILFKQYNVNQDLYQQRTTIQFNDRKQILTPANNQTYSGFRLDPNWNTETQAQVMRISVKLDDIDIENIENLKTNLPKLNTIGSYYTTKELGVIFNYGTEYSFDVTLNKETNDYSVNLSSGAQDFGYEYITEYNFYKELIEFHNLENLTATIPQLYESFTLISSYRNYHAFNISVSLRDQHPSQQIQQIKSRDYSKSLNANDQNEPSIFGLVRLRVAEKHFSLISGNLSDAECEEMANKLPFIISINRRLKIINLECKIKLLDLRTWQYTFQFYDLRRGKHLNDVNSLSAGQKAITHLIFEAYGRGDLKGGVVIIDEPEIHLHYQFQNEYLQVIKELNKEQYCQYVLVTHSEALINSSTINQVKRFSLDANGFTEIKYPNLTTNEKTLIKILDNTRSTYAFFSKKVILVEGDTDRYFLKSIIIEKYPEQEQIVAVLYMGGKGGYNEWSKLFKSFGLSVYAVCDLDFLINTSYPTEKGKRVKTSTEVADFKIRNPDWETKIMEKYTEGIFILKNGDLEHYLSLPKKGLTETIDFCNNSLTTYLADDSNIESKEIRFIVAEIIR